MYREKKEERKKVSHQKKALALVTVAAVLMAVLVELDRLLQRE